MSKFKDVKFSYEGEDFVIKANNTMKAIRSLSGVCGMNHLADVPSNLVKISDGFHALLEFCGCETTDEDVYCWLMSDLESNMETAVMSVMNVLHPMAVPPEKIQKYSPKKPKATTKKAKAK